jgi:hypothetical protein
MSERKTVLEWSDGLAIAGPVTLHQKMDVDDGMRASWCAILRGAVVVSGTSDTPDDAEMAAEQALAREIRPLLALRTHLEPDDWVEIEAAVGLDEFGNWSVSGEECETGHDAATEMRLSWPFVRIIKARVPPPVLSQVPVVEGEVVS